MAKNRYIAALEKKGIKGLQIWHMALKGSGKWGPENLWAGVGWYSCDVPSPHSLFSLFSSEGPLISCLSWWKRTYNQVQLCTCCKDGLLVHEKTQRQVCSRMLDNEFTSCNKGTCPFYCFSSVRLNRGSHDINFSIQIWQSLKKP